MDPGLITAALSACIAAFAVWQASKKDAVTASTASDVRRQELYQSGLESHFDRLEAEIESLSQRVDHLETERAQMLALLAANGIGWPPDV